MLIDSSVIRLQSRHARGGPHQRMFVKSEDRVKSIVACLIRSYAREETGPLN